MWFQWGGGGGGASSVEQAHLSFCLLKFETGIGEPFGNCFEFVFHFYWSLCNLHLWTVMIKLSSVKLNRSAISKRGDTNIAYKMGPKIEPWIVPKFFSHNMPMTPQPCQQQVNVDYIESRTEVKASHQCIIAPIKSSGYKGLQLEGKGRCAFLFFESVLLLASYFNVVKWLSC